MQNSIQTDDEEIKYSPYHDWSDDWPHWKELYAAEEYIGNYVYKYSRCRLSSKEKYGTLRYERIIPPRWCWYMWDMWIYSKWTLLGQKVLIRAVSKAVKKFPNVKEEILDDLNWFIA